MLLRSDLSPIIPVALLVAAFYFLVIRPTKTRQERAQEVEDHLKPGVEVMTSAGMFGTVASVDAENFLLEVSPGVQIKFVKGAVAKILNIESRTLNPQPPQKPGGRKSKAAKGGPAKSSPPPPEKDSAPKPQDGEEPGPKKL